MTSNPTIFEKAIAHSADYDEQLRAVLRATPALDTQGLFEALALDDIRAAADMLRLVFDRTDGNDGFVSFEVPASAADDTAVTISRGAAAVEGDRPAERDDQGARPPRPALPAIEQLTPRASTSTSR